MNPSPKLKIALVGPESTGKSTLTQQLAKHYKCAFVMEYAREYISKLKRPYNLEDIIVISKRQLELERIEFANSEAFLVCDTNLLVSKIWAENAFKTCPDFISENWKATDYEIQLLMDIDLPWQEDPLREHPHLRKFFFDWYERELIQAKANYFIISGTENQRLNNAIKIIDSYLKSKES